MDDDTAALTDAKQRDLRIDLAAVAAVLFVFVVGTAAALARRATLGHDEAVYAIRGRDLSDGWSTISGLYWADYRAPGLSMILNLAGRVVGFHVTTARAVVVGVACLILVATWMLGRQYGARWSAVVAMVLLIASSGFTVSSTQLLADIPGAAFSMFAIVFYVADLRRGSLRWSLLATPLLLAAATVSRFGAPFMVGAGLLAAFIVVLPDVWRRRNVIVVAQSAALAVGIALVSALLLSTRLLSLTDESPIKANQRLTGGKDLSPTTGMRDLAEVLNPWSDWPVPMYSKVMAVLLGVGVVAGVVGAVRNQISRQLVAFGLIAGFVSTVAITVSVGLVVANYLVMSLPFWVLAAGAGLTWLGSVATGAVSERSGPRLVIQLGAVAAGTLVVVSSFATTVDFHQGLDDRFSTVRAASVAAGATLGDDCALITGTGPQIGYYSECAVGPFIGLYFDDRTGQQVIDRSVENLESVRDPRLGCAAIGVVVIERGKRQPTEDQLADDALFDEAVVEFGRPGERLHRIQVFTLDPHITSGPLCAGT